MNNKRICLTVGWLAMVLQIPVAFAEAANDDSGFFAGLWTDIKTGNYYAGLSLGTATADASDEELEQALAAQGYSASATLDDSDTGYRLYLGWQFHEHWAAEVGYANLGELGQEVSATTSDPSGFLQALAEEQPLLSSGITLGAAAHYPLTSLGMADGDFARKFSVYGRVGLYVWQTEVEYAAGGVVVTDDNSGADLYFGVGVDYALTEAFTLGLGFERYNAETAIDFINLSAQYRFDLN